ncbi:MAG: hypothetical protein CRN43_19080 [Candidatus Nephrothrix sp. EaCA]|nr:MAG: hypothetical protein CRN43_19080 [Candidatus Nephrothrix sp. EaCA]
MTRGRLLLTAKTVKNFAEAAAKSFFIGGLLLHACPRRLVYIAQMSLERYCRLYILISFC